MNWKEAKYIENNLYELPGHWLKIEYFEALNILFRVENLLRMFVYIILKNEYGEKWKDLSVTSDDDENSTIGAIAKKRLSQDKDYAYLGYVITSPLLHLTSGELIRIIVSDTYWKYFKKYFPGSRDIIKNKLDEIGNVRNSLAHFRPLKKGDIELVKQNANHTLSVIEQTIKDFMDCPDIVPTNTDEDWYKELTLLKHQEIQLNYKQSKNEEFIKFLIDFEPPKLSEEDGFLGYTVRTLNLKTDNLLLNYPNLTKYVISCTERIPYGYTITPKSNKIIKQITLTISRNTLKGNYVKIKSELEKILLEVTNEIDLIKEDNLARGKLVEVVRCHYEKVEKYHSLKSTLFRTELTEQTPVEYWGNLNYISKDFTTDTDKYPWMPVDVSEDKKSLF
ncbi:Swt1 family HEPN domain-containing protein [Flavobacterium pallidum]|nr:Swt1 family HEPN domain-containing protein [Flavobacterium pallidum]